MTTSLVTRGDGTVTAPPHPTPHLAGVGMCLPPTCLPPPTPTCLALQKLMLVLPPTYQPIPHHLLVMPTFTRKERHLHVNKSILNIRRAGSLHGCHGSNPFPPHTHYTHLYHTVVHTFFCLLQHFTEGLYPTHLVYLVHTPPHPTFPWEDAPFTVGFPGSDLLTTTTSPWQWRGMVSRLGGGRPGRLPTYRAAAGLAWVSPDSGNVASIT